MSGVGLERQCSLVVKEIGSAARLPGFDLSYVNLGVLPTSVPQFSHL